MSSTVLQLIQAAAAEMALPVPTFVIGNSTTDVVQLLALANAAGNELQRQFPWQYQNKEYRFVTQYTTTTGNTSNGSAVITNIPSTTGMDTTYMVVGTGVPQDTYVASVDSGSQVTLSQALTATGTGVTLNFCKTKYPMPSDFDRMVDRTQWDKTKHWEMLGPEDAQQWQWLKSGYIATGPRLRFRIMGGTYQIWPPVTTAETLGFEYLSNGWVISASGTAKSSFTVDTDTCEFPDRLMVLMVKRKYFEVKGFDTTALERDFQMELSIAKANDSAAATLSFAPKPSQVLVGWANIPDSGYGS